MGGLFSISFAHEQPHRVDKLILIGHPAGGTREIPFMMRLMGVKGINKLMLRMIGTPNVEGAKAFHAMMLVGDTSRLSEPYWQNDVYAQMLPGTGASFSSLLENCVGLGGFKESYLMKSDLQELALPVYFIVGEKDVWDTVENAKSIVATMKNAEIHILEGAGHLPWLDHPEVCAQLIYQALSD